MPDICNPLGVVEPAYLGQMFLDPINHIFYQARGLTASDWCFVAPSELSGSFVKIYNLFLGLPPDDPAGPQGAEFVMLSKLVSDTIALDGVEILQAHRWKAGSIDVAQARLKFNRSDDISMFVGFAAKAKAYEMPCGHGFVIKNGDMVFGEGQRWIGRGETILLRVEYGEIAYGFVNDKPFGTMKLDEVGQCIPVVALFSHRQGERRIAPGYEKALQENLK
jgi:hypothetical protein